MTAPLFSLQSGSPAPAQALKPPRWRNGGFAPRIVALGIQGMTALEVSRRVGCSEEYAYAVLRAYREEGGEFFAAPVPKPPRRRLA